LWFLHPRPAGPGAQAVLPRRAAWLQRVEPLKPAELAVPSRVAVSRASQEARWDRAAALSELVASSRPEVSLREEGIAAPLAAAIADRWAQEVQVPMRRAEGRANQPAVGYPHPVWRGLVLRVRCFSESLRFAAVPFANSSEDLGPTQVAQAYGEYAAHPAPGRV